MLVLKGFSEPKGIDFDEIFSLMVKLSSIRMILGLAENLNLEFEQMDVKKLSFMESWKNKSRWRSLRGFSLKEIKTM
jgi:hypothetical protein